MEQVVGAAATEMGEEQSALDGAEVVVFEVLAVVAAGGKGGTTMVGVGETACTIACGSDKAVGSSFNV